ncbi:MAG: hypothetical protein ACKOTB_03470 [Planctomycetia bacterium]
MVSQAVRTLLGLSASFRSAPSCSITAIVAASLMMMTAPAHGVTHATDLSGRWVGSWESGTSGHKGPLFATFTRCGEGEYRVKFTGRFLKVVPFRYSVTLTVVEDHGDSVTLAGSSYLGRLFGTFSYQATADGCSFRADYSSAKDSGTFRLTRAAR